MIIILILVLTIILLLDSNEYFSDLDPKETPTKLNPTTFKLNDIYENTKYFDNSNTGKLGITECVEKCKGNCVEFGVTGYSFCFE